MSVVTVSRQFGSHADPIVAMAAKQLRFDVLDKDLIREVARRAKVDEGAVKELDEEEETGLIGFMSRWMDSEALARGAAFETGIFSWDLASQETSDEEHHILDRVEYHRIVEDVIGAVHERGKAVIMGRGGAMVLKEHSDVLRVRITASVESRAERVAELMKLDYRAAYREVESSDRRRAAFLRRWYQVDWADPALYHLVVNTDVASEERAAAVIVAGAKQLGD